MLEVQAVYTYLDIKFYVKVSAFLCLFGYLFRYQILYWGAYLLHLFGCLLKCQIVIKKIMSGDAVDLWLISANTIL